MKKSIIALATVAAMAAQADNTTLYGSIRMAYTYDSEGATVNGDTKSTSYAGDYGSRWGIKGSDDLGNGLTGFYKYETRVGGGDTTTKYLYAGLKGGFGTFVIGRTLIPRDNLSNNSDPSNLLEAGYGRNALTSTSNGLAYITPDMGGFTLSLAAVADGSDGVNRHIDAYDVMAEYKANGIYAGLGYQSTNVDGGDDWASIGLGLGYEADAFNVGLLVEREDADNSDTNPLFARLGGSFNISDMDSVYASVSMYDSDVANADEVWAALLGYQHKFTKRTRVWAEYGYRGETSDGADDESNKFALGLRTDF